jgi:ribosome-associated heat shock protein Hsp15
MSEVTGSVRVDRWLCAARIYKSRTSAQDACAASHVKVNGKNVRSSHPLKVGDKVEARAPRGDTILVVLALAEKRLSPPDARELYEDHSPPPPERGERVAERERGMGRPTKIDRRRMERFRGGF